MTSDVYGVFRLKVSRKLTAALKGRDILTVHALRAALHAVDNASALPAAEVAERLVHAGSASEVTGSTIDRAAIDRVLSAEAQTRRTAAREYEKLGRADKAQQFESEAEVIQACLKDLDTEDIVVER